MYSTKPCNSKRAAVNDGDDGDDNDDEDGVNKIWMKESFEEQQSKTTQRCKLFMIEIRENLFWVG